MPIENRLKVAVWTERRTAVCPHSATALRFDVAVSYAANGGRETTVMEKL
jgi:hypothetical protein